MKNSKGKGSSVWKNFGWLREKESSSVPRSKAGEESAKQAASGMETPRAPEDSPRKEGLLKKFQKHMAAAAFAESGEHVSAQEILEPVRRPKAVLLVIEGTAPDLSAFAYAMNLCARTSAQLDILRVIEGPQEEPGSGSAEDRIAKEKQQIADLEDRLRQTGVQHRITVIPGDTNQEVLNYTQNHRDISTVILDSQAGREAPGKAKKQTQLVRKIAQYLSVPVVTVLPRQPANAVTGH